jgi:colicin import membrane protein
LNYASNRNEVVMMFNLPDIPSETVKRITAAADKIYEDCGRQSFPNVDTVRRAARVNMNDASSVMRAWRRARTEAAAPLASPIPTTVQEAGQAMLGAVWSAAIAATNTRLQGAQTAWEQERADAEACRAQLATAFDDQGAELENARNANDAMQQSLDVQRTELLSANAEVGRLLREAADKDVRLAMADLQVAEISKRAEDLTSELDIAHANANQAGLDTQSRFASSEVTIAQLRNELKLTAERELSLREELAHMRGQLTVIDRNGALKRSVLPSTASGQTNEGAGLKGPRRPNDRGV